MGQIPLARVFLAFGIFQYWGPLMWLSAAELANDTDARHQDDNKHRIFHLMFRHLFAYHKSGLCAQFPQGESHDDQ